MFAKRLSLGKESLLSSKDKKKLQGKIGEQFISKQSRYKQNSVSGTRTKIYSEEEGEIWTPLFIEAEIWFPSIFFLWRNPNYLPVVYTWTPVSAFIIGGADLMWPGVVNAEEIVGKMKIGTLVAVSVVGNLPIAVGVLATESPALGNKGKCVRILHCYRDELWMMCQSIPNEGFLIEKVKSLIKIEKVEERKEENFVENDKEVGIDLTADEKISESHNKNMVSLEALFVNTQESNENKEIKEAPLKAISLNTEELVENKEIKEEIKECYQGIKDELIESKEFKEEVEECLKILKNTTESVKDSSEHSSVLNDPPTEPPKHQIDNLKEPSELNQETSIPPTNILKETLEAPEFSKDSSESTPEETKDSHPALSPDEIMMEVLLTAITVALKPEDLPLEPSALQSLMQRCRRSYTLDFSQTSYKKIGKFLEHLNNLKLIQYEKPKSSDHKLVTVINRSHPLLQNFVPIVRKAKAVVENSTEVDSRYPKVIFSYILIAKLEYREFFSVVLLDKSHRAFEKSEINALLIKYLTAKGLECSKNTIKTDSVLQKALKCGEQVPKAEIFQKFRNLFEEGYLTTFTSGLLPEHISIGQVPTVTVTVTKGKGKFKKITTVSGFDHYQVDMDELQSISQKEFSATASVLKDETRAKTLWVLQIFGNHSEKFPKLLNEFFKIPLSHIQVIS